MNDIFESKFRNIITSSTNRKKSYDFLLKYIEDHASLYSSQKEKDDLLYCLFYEVSFEFSINPNKENIFNTLQQKHFLHSHPNFNEIKRDVTEEEAFIDNPPKVKEGLIVCKRCHSKNTISFEKQTRSSDEPMSIFINCLNCRKIYKL